MPSRRGASHRQRTIYRAQPCRANHSTTAAPTAAGSRRRLWPSPASRQSSTGPPGSGTPNGSRAPLDRPPTTSGTFDTGNDRTTATQAASSCPAGAGDRRPATRYGWVTRTTVTPAASAALRTAARSGAPTSPPAPWPSTSRLTGRDAGRSTATRAGPCGVAPSVTWDSLRAVRPQPGQAPPRVPAEPAAPTRPPARSCAPAAGHRSPARRARQLAMRPAWPCVRAAWWPPTRRGSHRPPAPRPGTAPAPRRCDTAPPLHRPAHWVPERTFPDRRFGTILGCARLDQAAAHSQRATAADRGVPLLPREGVASSPWSSTHLPRGSYDMRLNNMQRRARLSIEPSGPPAVVSLALRRRKTRVLALIEKTPLPQRRAK